MRLDRVSTTGCGTPQGLAECRGVKIATRTDLARCWHDLMDVDAGRIAEVGWELFHLLLEVASGRRTRAEHCACATRRCCSIRGRWLEGGRGPAPWRDSAQASRHSPR